MGHAVARRGQDLVIYRIDRNDAIVYVNDRWTTFALANDAAELAAAAVIGRSLWDFVCDSTTGTIYRDILVRVRAGRQVTFPFRCDSSSSRRSMRMTVVPAGAGQVQFESEILETDPAAEGLLWNRHATRGDDMVTVCSWCKQVKVGGGWAEIEDAVAALESSCVTAADADARHVPGVL